MNTASLLVVSSRLLLLILAMETLVRYAIWWRRARDTVDRSIFVPLLLGITFTMLSFVVQIEAGIELSISKHHSYLLDPRLFASLVLGIVGTVFHVIPCWRLTNHYSNRRIAFEIAWRSTAVVVLGWLAT